MSMIREIKAKEAGGTLYSVELGALGEHIRMEDGETLEKTVETWRGHGHPEATAFANGFLSGPDKAKLNSISPGADHYVHPTGNGFQHVPAGGAAGEILRCSAPGAAEWDTERQGVYPVFDRTAPGLAPASGGSTLARYLREDGSFAVPQDLDTTYAAVTRLTAGLVPAPGGAAATRYLREDGTFAVPPDTDTTYPEASASQNGLMSARDKAKLDTMALGANHYEHPSSHSASLFTVFDGRTLEEALIEAGIT